MENLEEIFKGTKKRMQKGVFDRDTESQAKVQEIIRQMEDTILRAFRGRVPYKYQGTLEQALAELRDTANSVNTRPLQELCDRATSIVARTEKEVEEGREENLPAEDRKREEQKVFSQGREDIRGGKREVDRYSAEKRLEEAVQTAFNKIKGASLADSGLRAPEIFSVEVTRDQVFKAYPQLFNKLFDKNIEVVDGLILKEYDELEQVTLGDLKPRASWDLRNYGTSREAIQQKTTEAVRMADEKPKGEPKRSEPLPTDWII